MKKEENMIYREVQRLQQFWLKLLMGGIAVFIWYISIQQLIFKNPFGSKPASDRELFFVWLIVGIILPIFVFYYLKLVIEVRSDGLYFRLYPFHFRYKRIPFSIIESYQGITYHPLKRFGGWGLRFNLKGELAYTIDGREAIELELADRTIVIGTRKPEELAEAISSMKNK